MGPQGKKLLEIGATLRKAAYMLTDTELKEALPPVLVDAVAYNLDKLHKPWSVDIDKVIVVVLLLQSLLL